MKKISRKIALLFSVCLLSFAAMAQGPAGKKGPKKGPSFLTEEVITKLELSSDQVAELKKIQKNQAVQMKTIREKHGEDKAAAAEAMKALRSETDAKVKEVMTPTQFTEFQKLQPKKQQKGGKPGKKGNK